MTKKYIVNPESMVDWYYDPTAEETEEALLIMAKQTFESLDSIPPSILEKSSYDSWMKNHQDDDEYAELDPSECVLGQNESDKKRQPMPTVLEADHEALPPARLDAQVNFNSWLDSVGYTSSPERLEMLYTDMQDEVRTMKDVLFTRFEMEAGERMDRDELRDKAFGLFKDLYPKDVIYPKQYEPKDDFKLDAKITQTLSFIGKGMIKLTQDQVTDPDSPDQYEVMKVLFEIKTEKELSGFIKSAKVDSDDFSKEGVGELLSQLEAKKGTSVVLKKPGKGKNP